MKTLQEFWASFESMVIPRDASPTQREECYRSFMSGASAAYKLMMVGADVQAEVRAFFDRMDRIARREGRPYGQ